MASFPRKLCEAATSHQTFTACRSTSRYCLTPTRSSKPAGDARINGAPPPPTGRTPFQCDDEGDPMPVAGDGTQALATPCNKIPGELINPITQQMMALYPLPIEALLQGPDSTIPTFPPAR